MRLLSPEAEVTRSLSNLFKPWSVQTVTSDARVIDSNERMMEYLKKNPPQMMQQMPENEEALFAGGDTEPSEPEIDHVALAKEEAERILAEANAEADKLVAQANERVREIEDTARSQGYEAGQNRLQEELAEKSQALQEDYDSRLQALEEDYRSKRDSMEHELIDAIVPAFEKVFGVAFAHKKELLLYLTDRAVLNIEGEKHFRIKVAEGQVSFLESSKEEILNHVGHDVELEVIGDPRMEENDCIIETDSGVFDCGLKTQLKNLSEDIRALCS